MGRVKRAGREYGLLGSRYVREFRQKWIDAAVSLEEPLLGSTDIQSLPDPGNSYEVVREMHLLPFNKGLMRGSQF